MGLRSDIAAAAARMTSGYDVNREIRQLAAYLREGESVQRLVSGVYGTGAGLLAVTDHRVLLLRDGRSGQASEGFPLERLSSVDWTIDDGSESGLGNAHGNPVRGTISISDSNSVAELRDVSAEEGEEIVRYIRALIEAATSAPRRRWQHELSSPASSTTTTPAGVVSSPVSSTVSSPTTPTASTSVSSPTVSSPTPTVSSVSSQTVSSQTVSSPTTPTAAGSVAGSAAASSSRTTPTRVDGNPAAATQPTSPPNLPPPPFSTPWTPGTFTGAHDTADPTRGAVPVSLLAETATIPRQYRVEATTAAAPRAEPEDSGAPALMAGEVPVSQLADRSTAVRRDQPHAAEDSDAEPDARPDRGTDSAADGQATASERESASRERPIPISWRMPSQLSSGLKSPASRSTATATATSKTTSVRVEATNKPPKITSSRAGARRKRWMWLGAGAAGLIGIAAIGSAKLVAPTPPAAPVSPTPAAVDTAAGPVVTVTKVVDGDTVEVTGQELTGPVEVLGIVAPRLDRGQCGAATAKAFATRTLNNTQVTLVTDPSQPLTTRTGHRLAFLKLPGGEDYSVLAARAGMVRYFDSPQPVMLADEIKSAEAEAQRGKAGIWGPPCNAKPDAKPDARSNAKPNAAAQQTRGAANAGNANTANPASAATTQPG